MRQAKAIAYDVSSRSWVRGAPGRGSARLPRLDGVLSMDDKAINAAGEDFGHLRRTRPLAVLEPGSEQDIARMVCFARENKLKIGPRGQGHTAFGQSQVEGGIVVRMMSLQRPSVFGSDRVEVSGGTTWREVLAATLTRGLRPPVLTHNLSLTVGGTLSVGGIDGGSYRYGAQVDNVLALQVVTGEGKIETCSPEILPELFEAVLAGQGQCGMILRATLRLIPAHTHTLFYQLIYPDIPTLLADHRMLIADGRFDRFSAHILPNKVGGWTFFAQAGRNYNPPEVPDQDALLAGMHHLRGFERIYRISYFDSADRGSKHIAGLIENGRIEHPHPWFDMFLPEAVAEQFAAEAFAVLKPSDLEPDFPIEFYGFYTDLCTRPLFRLPEGPIAFLLDIMTTYPDAGTAQPITGRNRIFFERARELGGKHYPIGAIPLEAEDWRKHYAPFWEQFAAAKRRFDPDGILAPGPGIF